MARTKQTARMSALGNIRSALTPKKPTLTVEMEDSSGKESEDEVPMLKDRASDLGMAEEMDESMPDSEDSEMEHPTPASASMAAMHHSSSDKMGGSENPAESEFSLEELLKRDRERASTGAGPDDKQRRDLKVLIIKMMGKAGK
jgi:hypothetical protein